MELSRAGIWLFPDVLLHDHLFMDQYELEAIISQYRVYLQVEKGLQPGTYTVYLSAVQYFVSFCTEYHDQLFLPDQWQLSDLGIRELEFFLREHLKSRKWKTNTVISYLNSVRSFFRFLHEKQFIKKNPIRHFTMKQQMQELIFSNISEEEIRQLFQKPVEQTFDGYLNRLLLEMFYGLGITPSKLVKIDFVELDKENGKIKITSGKQIRILPIALPAIEVLKHYLMKRRIILEQTKSQVSAFLINHGGKKLTRKKVGEILKKELEGIGLIGERVHILRNLSTKHFADHGADVRSLQKHRDMKRLSTLEAFKNETFDTVLQQFKKLHIREEQTKNKDADP
ncbi:MAG: tyrosine-type recombinase/integrase [SAR324 cluster bacterium]|nr:tyrosine-type recombinase/integrase [SAR324 cluster bacterium]